MKKKYVLLPIMIGLSLPSWAKSKPAFLSPTYDLEWNDQKQETIKGLVKASDGIPVVGASITNLSTGKSTQTNADGAFEIGGSVGQNLKISMVGYHAQTLKIESNQIRVNLQNSDQSLDEVVVGMENRRYWINLFLY